MLHVLHKPATNNFPLLKNRLIDNCTGSLLLHRAANPNRKITTCNEDIINEVKKSFPLFVIIFDILTLINERASFAYEGGHSRDGRRICRSGQLGRLGDLVSYHRRGWGAGGLPSSAKAYTTGQWHQAYFESLAREPHAYGALPL